MRVRLVLGLVPVLAAALTLSFLYAQDRSPPAASVPSTPPAATAAPAAPAPARTPARDLSQYNPLQRQMFLSAQCGADWLYRMNGVKGRFVYGYLPALKQEMDGDHYLRQLGAAFALARAARFTGEERYAVRATQAVLALLEETVVEAGEPALRHTALASVVVNRLGSAGLLVLAINELPAPQADLLEKSEQLCQFIRSQARPDGSLRCDDAAANNKDDDNDAVSAYPGLALYGLARSQTLRPAPWKLDLLRRGLAYYGPWWQAHRSLAFVPAQTAACTEAFLLTREPTFLQFVAQMNDWLATLQYDQIDPRHLDWYGGFAGWADGRKLELPPDAGSAAFAGALADACRACRAAGDADRHQRYTEALQRALQFLVTLQYTDATTQHFADWYRPRIVGAFHASHQDGNLRIDHTATAVAALVHYLDQAAPEARAAR
jgi:hypothetical protein